ncbi:hypothetical protein MRB53_023595 [Persea americana]|uniref:Uncharacterized protein n=1 Tax=Persea americana TaxID=3435 RepID=A0ACC2LAZ6_PERAE|nr:hypothetical protein MRB53_023595 [Persea americana]
MGGDCRVGRVDRRAAKHADRRLSWQAWFKIVVIKFLIEETIVEVNSRNMNGLTALDLLTICPRESTGEMEIAEILRRRGAKQAWELPKPNGEDSEVALVDPPQFQDSEVKQDCEAVVSLASLSQQIKELWISRDETKA